MERENITKSGRKKYISAISVLFILISSFLIGCQNVLAASEIGSFNATPTTADVGESVIFYWFITGGYKESYLKFGDGTTEEVTGLLSKSHEYAIEGSFQAMLLVVDYTNDIVNQTINIIIKNNAPDFNISFSNADNIAGEDEVVNISITDLVESTVDQEAGKLTYIYDFADGIENQVSTNLSSVSHSWSNEGVYPVTVSIIDDQNAIRQHSKDITITNTPPQGRINISVDDDYDLTQTEYIASFNWRPYEIGSVPDLWDLNYVNPNQWLDTASTNASIDVVSDIHDKVLKLQDSSDNNSITMENTFSDQSLGTVEFWVQSGDVSSKTWALSLWDENDLAFRVLMNDNQWQYTTSSFYQNILPYYSGTSIDTPVNDEWYHVRIDFNLDNSTNNYYGLNESQFRITINDIQSIIYEIDNLDVSNVNKILLQSGISDTGVSLIDAIGYSWAPGYLVGDNRWPVLNYPDKSVFLLSAAESIDTSSDMDSLRYYWQFGDGTTGYGKHVHHQYTKSGLYRINMTVKDDNGDINSITRFISVNNLAPDINFTLPSTNIVIYEGETAAFNVDVDDDFTDLATLEYWWNYEFDGAGLDLNNLTNFELGGWKGTHIYRDDFDGKIYIVAKDREDTYSSESVGIQVLNVDPSLSIWDTSIMANSTLFITRSEEDMELNFDINLFGNSAPELQYFLESDDSDTNILNTNREVIDMSLSKSWKLIVNASTIPNMTWIKYDYFLEFNDGQELVISSDRLYPGSDGYWEVDLNPYFYDNSSYNFKYPITFSTQLWDPSNDDLSLTVNYNAYSFIELNCTPDTQNFMYNIGGINYIVNVSDRGGDAMANISITTLVGSKLYDNNEFPVSLDLDYSIDPLFDMDAILSQLETDLGQGPLSIVDCVDATHYFSSSVVDDDGGNDSLIITFNTTETIEFDTLSIRLDCAIPETAAEIRDIELFADIFDFNRVYDLQNEIIEFYNSSDPSSQSLYDIEFLLTSEKIPHDTHSFIECIDGTFYIVDSSDISNFLKSSDNGLNWSTALIMDPGFEIKSLWYDRLNGYIYITGSNTTAIDIVQFRVIDDSINNRFLLTVNNSLFSDIDIILENNVLYVRTGIINNGYALMHFESIDINTLTSIGSNFNNMSLINGRTFNMSYCVFDGYYIYYLWQWSNNGTEMWKFDIFTSSFEKLNVPELYDTALLDDPQTSLTYDSFETIGFVLNDTEIIEPGQYPGTFNFDYEMEQGIYYGTNSFEDNATAFNGWTNYGFNTVEITENKDGHNTTLHLQDNDTDNDYYDTIFSESQPNGTIEFWLYAPDPAYTGWNHDIFVANIHIYYHGGNDRWEHYSTGSSGAFSNGLVDQWIHFKLVHNGSTNTLQIYVNGNLEATNTDAYGSLTGLRFYEYDAEEIWIDAIGYSWDNWSHNGLGYEIGNNINPYDIEPLLNEGFEVGGGQDSYIQITTEYKGHKDVLQFYDNKVTDYVQIIDRYPGQITGTIEWWWLQDSGTGKSAIYIYGESTGICIGMAGNGQFYWRDNSTVNDVKPYSANTWYHNKLVFNCSAGVRGTFSWYIDGVLEAENIEMRNSCSYLNLTRLMSDYTVSNFNTYFDALSYSWDANYTIGDNIYKIPAKLNETGHYVATHSFENIVPGTKGTAIDFFDEYQGYAPSYYTQIEIQGYIDGHRNIINMGDAQGAMYTYGVHHIDNPQSAGTIEFYSWANNPTHVGSATKRHYIYFRARDNTIAFRMMVLLHAEKVQYYDGSSWQDLALTIPEKWYHHSITFDCEAGTNGQFTWIVSDENGTEINRVENIEFENDLDTIDEIYLGTNNADYRGTTRWDAFGFSWDPNYNIGDNLFDPFDKHYYYTYNIESNELNKGLLCDAVVMLDRNTVPGLYEKCFAISDNKIYQIGADGMIGLVAELNSTSPIIAISDNYIMTEDKSVYQISYRFFEGNCSILYNDGSGDAQIQQNLLLAWYLSSPFSTVFDGEVDFMLEGDYLIQMIADNGITQTISGGLIETEAYAPYCSIGTLPNSTIEDQQLELISDIIIFGSEDTNSSDYRIEWNFGDGTYSYEQNPVHSWSTAGTYNITLFVVDCYGKTYLDYKIIIIEEQIPEIRGPLTFQGLEGQAILLDIEIYDSFIDEQYLTYTWYDEYDAEIISFRNNKKPTLVLTDGFYRYKLRVEDQDGNFAMANITVIVDDLPPRVFTSNYLYSGPSGGTVELQAYVYDNVNDLGDYEYEWMLTYGDVTTTHYGGKTGRTNIYSFSNDIDMRICRGQVTATDTVTGKTCVASFTITNYLDSNLNGVPDDYEWMVEEIGLVYIITWEYDDTDDDGLIDMYEEDIYTYNTSMTNPDTDGDGLWDGYDPYTGIGERSVGTNPVKNDTDDDSLLDSLEYYGWNITTELFGPLHVTSDPLVVDTDNDGLFDGDEYVAGSDPRNPDTDGDGLTDGNDPYPAKADGDKDGLSDYREYELGTAMDNSDTDGDGLSDGEEVLGWGFYTNPLDADSDHDFLSDSAEMQSAKFELGERRDLDKPISLWFDDYSSKASSAQISIMIAFGEASAENGYGIIDVPNINVIITKADDKLVLLNENTNKTRYYSKAIDIREAIEDNSLNYRGEYVVSINDTSAGCLLEQFEIEVVKYLDPLDDDYDGDRIMDGVETGLLVKGWDTIDINDTMDVDRGYYSGIHSFDYDMEQGKYYGTYDFHNETVGIAGTNISMVDGIGVDYTSEIINSHEGHVNVLEVYRSGTFGDYPYDLVTSPASGTVELWMNGNGNIELQGNSNRLVIIGYDGVSNFVRIYHDTTYTDVPSIEGWAHVRIDFNCSTDQQSVWINGVNAVTAADFYDSNTASYIDKVCFPVPNTNMGYYDAIGYSWDNSSHDGQGYEESWNVNPYDITPLLEEGFDLSVYSDCSIRTVNEDGHNGVLEFLDDNNSGNAVIEKDSDNQTSGTVEFWVRSNDTTKIFYMGLIAPTGAVRPYIRFGEGFLKYIVASGAYDICPVSDDTWYHIRIDFECGSSSYMGLSSNTYYVYVNGQKYGPYDFRNSGNFVSGVRFSTRSSHDDFICYVDAIGYSWDPYYNISDNMRDYIGDFDEYSLEIPYVGRVYDANINLKISSNMATIGKGNVTVQLVKENMNNTISDVLFYDTFSVFDTEIFTYENVLDLSSYIGSGVIPEYYGTYRLRIKVNSTFAPEIIYVNEFTIDTYTYIQAGPKDTKAWITDPSKWDTDGDGWSDHYEIYERGDEPTNPLSVDTDGDGVWDRFDRDPLRDLIIEINPQYGAHRNLWFYETSPYLEITASLKSGGSEYFFCTPSSRANDERVRRFSYLVPYWGHTYVWWFGWHRVPIIKFRWQHLYHNRKAYFNGKRGSYDSRYYANIDDDMRKQGSWMDIQFDLWQMGGLWDNHLISAKQWYWIGSHGHQQTFTIHQRGLFRGYNSMQVKVRTIGLEKANTIAIYDNETVFNGHYQQKERMNVIQLFVKDSSANLAGTPFEYGSNSIVIPTSLFTETLLNKYVQDENLDETVLYANGKSKFISIERDGETEAACDDIDFIYVRYDISAEDAMEVLRMLITILVNDTTEELAVGYEYSSTKEDGFKAVLMNLPGAVLGFVPWECNYQNSAQGRRPRNFFQWLVQTVVSFATFVVNLFIAIGEAFASIFEQIVKFVTDVLLNVVAILAYLLWCLIRVAILIFVWIEFVFLLLIMVIVIIAIMALMMIFKIFLNIDLTISINEVIAEGDISLSAGYYIEFNYIHFFDLLLPIITIRFAAFGFGFEFSSGLFSEKFEFTELPNNFIDPILNNNTIKSSKSSENVVLSKTTSTSQSKSFVPPILPQNAINSMVDLLTGIGVGMGFGGGAISIFAMALYVGKGYEKAINYITFAAYITSILVFVISFMLGKISPAQLFGVGAGFLAVGFICCTIGDMLKKPMAMYKWGKIILALSGLFGLGLFSILSFFDNIYSIVGLFFDIEALSGGLESLWGSPTYNGIMLITSLIFGGISLVTAVNAMIFLGGYYRYDDGTPYKSRQPPPWTQDTKAKYVKKYALFNFITGIILMGMAMTFQFFNVVPSSDDISEIEDEDFIVS